MSETAQHPVVQLNDGAVRGRAESGVAAFLGIPTTVLSSLPVNVLTLLPSGLLSGL